MENFRLLSRTRQITEYSCGASALQAVLRYWGHDLDETAIMEMIGTSSDVGSYPDSIERGVRALGLQAQVREDLTLEDVRAFTADGHPMIALGQVWRSQRSSVANPEDDWDNGHYIVVLGVDDQYVYFQDPYLRMGKVFVTRTMFEKHWHQAMGGVEAGAPKLRHLGILIRGEKPVQHEAKPTAALDYEKLGSLNLMVIQFDSMMLPFDLLDELREFLASTYVRVDAMVFVCKDIDGNISAMEGGNLDSDADATEINALLAALTSRSLGLPEAVRTKAQTAIQAAAAGDFGLSAEDIRSLANKLSPDQSAIILLFENVWERRFRKVIRKYDGDIIKQRFVSPESLAKMAADIGL